MLLALFFSFLVAFEEDPSVCGGYGVRCNGSTPFFRSFFYPCCVPRTYCTGLDGFCQWLPGETASPTVGANGFSDSPCGAVGTRCDGTGSGAYYACCNFYPCCVPGSGCTGINGSCQLTNVTQPTYTPPPTPEYQFIVPTKAPTSGAAGVFTVTPLVSFAALCAVYWLFLQ